VVLPNASKVRELLGLFRSHARSLRENQAWAILRFCDEYDALLTRYCHIRLTEATTFEIGFGTRAGVMIGLTSLGAKASGVDLDAPLLHPSMREIARMYRANGPERMLKSIVRFFTFDLMWRAQLATALRARGHKLLMPTRGQLLIQDAASVDLPDHSIDLIVSESVFEHIPFASLKILIAKMSRWLKPSGLALIRPDVFTGISGAHLMEWFDLNPRRVRKSEPWEHLRKRRYRGNVYLNELRRSDYRALFSRYFQLLEEQVVDPNQGREFYTPDVAQELKDYGEDELFSNGVLFVMRPISSVEIRVH
jgi:hypothetical protein